MPRKSGERNWEDEAEEYDLHIPTSVIPSDDLEHTKQEQSGLVWVHGVPYIRALDGKLEPLDP